MDNSIRQRIFLYLAVGFGLIGVLLFGACDDSDDTGLDDENDSAADADTDTDTDADTDTDGDTDSDTDSDGDTDGEGDVNVTPQTINDVLVNPGMGFADFHFRWWCNLPPIDFTPEECAQRVLEHWPVNYPDSAVAYFRWNWRDIEPVRGEIAYDLIDTTIQSANLLGETLSFRVITILEGDQGIPEWLTQDPYNVPGQTHNGTFWPDYRDATFRAEHQRLLNALAQRYDNHPGIDHVDVGTVGCWGEWNTACLSGTGNIFEIYNPQNDQELAVIVDAYQGFVDDHLNAFANTPVVMLGIGTEGGPSAEVMAYAAEQGAGWRVDCWGDWAWNGTANWSHMGDLYPAMIENVTALYPQFPDVWKTAPVQLEVCGTLPTWAEYGWTADAPDGEVYKTFQWALDQHASVLNAKSTDIPAQYVDAMNDMLKKNGYRFVLDRFNHFSTVTPGQQTTFVSNWHNAGVAPSYNPRTMSYRLRNDQGESITFASNDDIRNWLPGVFNVVDTVEVPADLTPGTYALDIALLDQAGTNPTTAPLPPLFLGIEGRMDDGWYNLSQITVTP